MAANAGASLLAPIGLQSRPEDDAASKTDQQQRPQKAPDGWGYAATPQALNQTGAYSQNFNSVSRIF